MTVRTMLSIAASKGWIVPKGDVYNVVLQGYVRASQKRLGRGLVYKLIKSFYGLNQASRQCNVKLKNSLIGEGFQQSHLDYSFMTKKVGDYIWVVLIYVDDLLMIGSICQMIKGVKQVLKESFKIKDLGDLRFYLAMNLPGTQR